MTTYQVELEAGFIDARITIERSTVQGEWVSSIAFDDEGKAVAETDSTLYFDYCHAEIVERELAKMFPTLPWETINYAIGDAGLSCNCNEEEGDDA